LIFGLLSVWGGASAQTTTYDPSLVHKNGAMAYEHMNYLAYEIGQRIAGTEKERLAEAYIRNQFERMEFETYTQEFTYTRRGVPHKSSNEISYKPGQSSKQIIVVAHYDSVSTGF